MHLAFHTAVLYHSPILQGGSTTKLKYIYTGSEHLSLVMIHRPTEYDRRSSSTNIPGHWSRGCFSRGLIASQFRVFIKTIKLQRSSSTREAATALWEGSIPLVMLADIMVAPSYLAYKAFQFCNACSTSCPKSSVKTTTNKTSPVFTFLKT